VHLTIGTADSYYLDGWARRLEAAFRNVGGHADFTFVPNATHGVDSLHTRDGDRGALYKDLTNAMYAVARPQQTRISKTEPAVQVSDEKPQKGARSDLSVVAAGNTNPAVPTPVP
jgi:hypothetical protein